MSSPFFQTLAQNDACVMQQRLVAVGGHVECLGHHLPQPVVIVAETDGILGAGVQLLQTIV